MKRTYGSIMNGIFWLIAGGSCDERERGIVCRNAYRSSCDSSGKSCQSLVNLSSTMMMYSYQIEIPYKTSTGETLVHIVKIRVYLILDHPVKLHFYIDTWPRDFGKTFLEMCDDISDKFKVICKEYNVVVVYKDILNMGLKCIFQIEELPSNIVLSLLGKLVSTVLEYIERDFLN